MHQVIYYDGHDLYTEMRDKIGVRNKCPKNKEEFPLNTKENTNKYSIFKVF